MSALRSGTLAEARAAARAQQQRIRDHERWCTEWCSSSMVAGKCQQQKDMKAELTRMQSAIKTWFDPPPDAETLF